MSACPVVRRIPPFGLACSVSQPFFQPPPAIFTSRPVCIRAANCFLLIRGPREPQLQIVWPSTASGKRRGNAQSVRWWRRGYAVLVKVDEMKADLARESFLVISLHSNIGTLRLIRLPARNLVAGTGRWQKTKEREEERSSFCRGRSSRRKCAEVISPF